MMSAPRRGLPVVVNRALEHGAVNGARRAGVAPSEDGHAAAPLEAVVMANFAGGSGRSRGVTTGVCQP